MNAGVSQSANASNFSAGSGNLCQLALGGGTLPPVQAYDSASYLIATGAGLTGGTVTIQVMDALGAWHNVAKPAPITLAASTNYTDNLICPAYGFRMAVASLAGGVITFAQIVATVR